MSKNSAASVPWLSAEPARPFSWVSANRRRTRAKSFYSAAATCCTASLLFAVACRSPLSARNDAGPGADVQPDIPRPSDVARDLAAEDLAPPDLAKPAGTPRAFRFDNHTERTAYVQVESPVGCRMQDATGWQECSYFEPICSPNCAYVQVGQSCCTPFCGAQLLAVYAIPPGASRSLPWQGNVYTAATDNCSACTCQRETPVTSGNFEASASVYADYRCLGEGCGTPSDGKLQNAAPAGEFASLSVPFIVPHIGKEVVLDITWLPPSADAGTPPDVLPPVDPPADSALADVASPRDTSSEPSRVTLADLAGHTYRIAADDTFPDASVYDRACSGSTPGAIYELVFSADATQVSIVRVDGPQQKVLTALLMQQPSLSSHIDYDIENAFAGGQLSIRTDGSTFIALLVLYGSGVPVIWCIDSPMTPA